MTVGTRLIHSTVYMLARKRSGITATELAAELNVSTAQARRYLQGAASRGMLRIMPKPRYTGGRPARVYRAIT